MADSPDPVSGLLHVPTQVHDGRVDVTAAEIFEIDSPGRIDFGGGELEPAGLAPHDRVWRNEGDDYQWWHLSAGQYLVEYNETIEATEPVVIQPREALLERGAFHPTVHVESITRLPLAVGGAGLKVKENARISTVVPRQR